MAKQSIPELFRLIMEMDKKRPDFSAPVVPLTSTGAWLRRRRELSVAAAKKLRRGGTGSGGNYA